MDPNRESFSLQTDDDDVVEVDDVDDGLLVKWHEDFGRKLLFERKISYRDARILGGFLKEMGEV